MLHATMWTKVQNRPMGGDSRLKVDWGLGWSVVEGPRGGTPSGHRISF